MLVALALFYFLAPSVIIDKTRPKSLQQCGVHSRTDCDYRRHIVQQFGTGTSLENSLDDNGQARPPAPLVPSPEHWRYPYFESIVDTIRSHITKDRSSPENGVYILEEGFLPEDSSWINVVRVERMHRKSKVLYRPEIVNDLVHRMEEILASERKVGLQVKGPQGVGKSYSLINLTRYLLASKRYWVTIIPNGVYWSSERDFFECLLESVGVDPFPLRLEYNATTDKTFAKLIHDIDAVLSQHGMKWVFIFDQIDNILGRPQFQTTKDIAKLSFPFSMMHHVMKPGRIISIISASANTDVSRQENHPLFEVFEHPTQWNVNEISLLYPSDEIVKWDWEELEYWTGLVPLYLHRWVKDPYRYYSDVCNEIEYSLVNLCREQEEQRWAGIVESAIQCLLCLSLTERPLYFDRKFSLVKEDKAADRYKIVFLFPFVEERYRRFFWDELVTYINGRF